MSEKNRMTHRGSKRRRGLRGLLSRLTETKPEQAIYIDSGSPVPDWNEANKRKVDAFLQRMSSAEHSLSGLDNPTRNREGAKYGAAPIPLSRNPETEEIEYL